MVIILVAGAFALMGVIALARPGFVLAQFGVAVNTPSGRAEVRAVYGGFGLAISGLLVSALREPALRGGIVTAVAVSLLGMAAGRLAARCFERLPGFYPTWLFFLLEVGAGAALLYT
jgi:hypothetical protein